MEYYVKEVSMGTEYSSNGSVVKRQTTPVDGGQLYVHEVFNIDTPEVSRFFSDYVEASNYAVEMLNKILLSSVKRV